MAATPVRVNNDLDRLENAARTAEDAVKNGPQTCAVLAVANSHETLWTHVVPGSDQVKLDSIFPLASITKPITATAVMQLVEDGRLLLDRPVSLFIPELTGEGREKITTWQLLTHSSGLNEDEAWQVMSGMDREATFQDSLELCYKLPLNFEPGTAHRYTTITFQLLAELVTRLSGVPYPQYLQERIFNPLGMASTGFTWLDPERAAPVHGFEVPEQLEGFNRVIVAGGGLYSTAADLVAFGQAFLRAQAGDTRPHILAPATIRAMTKHYTAGRTQTENGREAPFNYALGWGKPSSPTTGDILASESAYGHGGATGTLLWIDPEWDLVYVWLTNTWNMQDPLDAKSRALNVVYSALAKQ